MTRLSGKPDVLDLPRTGLVVEARDAALHRSKRFPKRSGVVAETLPDLANADGFMDVAAQEQSGHALCHFENGLAPDCLPRLDHVESTIRGWRVCEENVRRAPPHEVHAVIGPLVRKASAGERAPADAGNPPPQPRRLTAIDRHAATERRVVVVPWDEKHVRTGRGYHIQQLGRRRGVTQRRIRVEGAARKVASEEDALDVGGAKMFQHLEKGP